MAAIEVRSDSVPSCLAIVHSIIKSKKNSNGIIDLEKQLLCDDENIVLAAIEGSGKLFSFFVENGYFFPDVTAEIDKGEIDEKYCHWLKERYTEIKVLMYDHLQHPSISIQESALFTLMKFVKGEGENPIARVPASSCTFPKEIIRHIVESMCSDRKDMEHLIFSFTCYTVYNDIKLYVLKAVLSVLEKHEKDPSSLFLHNIFRILSQMRFPCDVNIPSDSVLQGETFVGENGKCPVFRLKCSVFRRIFSSAWIKFLSFKLPSSLYKSVLISLHQEVLPHLNNPLLLTDFFTDSYNVGGVVSLLALNGLFFLVQNYNLEYPNFYQKLYALFQPDVIASKYRGRFFFWADLFLTSTHLPSYLVAAFVKRLARLALGAPPHVLLIVIPFIGNLLIRHPSLKVLMHCPNKPDITSDPYDAETSDPANCGAIDSCLWEIKSLQNHWHPAVSKKAKLLNNSLPQIEWNISSALEVDIDDLVEKESDVNFKNVPMSFQKPLGLFHRNEDKMHDLWTL